MQIYKLLWSVSDTVYEVTVLELGFTIGCYQLGCTLVIYIWLYMLARLGGHLYLMNVSSIYCKN